MDRGIPTEEELGEMREATSPVAYLVATPRGRLNKLEKQFSGKSDNCRVAVSVSVASCNSSLPITWRLYLPERWAGSKARRAETGIPRDIRFQTKPEIALAQIRQALADGVPEGVVLADPAYGNNTGFREGLRALGRSYVMGIESSTRAWPPGQQPLAPPPRSGRGRPPSRLRRDAEHAPLTVKAIAKNLPASASARISWRQGTRHRLCSLLPRWGYDRRSATTTERRPIHQSGC